MGCVVTRLGTALTSARGVDLDLERGEGGHHGHGRLCGGVPHAAVGREGHGRDPLDGPREEDLVVQDLVLHLGTGEASRLSRAYTNRAVVR